MRDISWDVRNKGGQTLHYIEDHIREKTGEENGSRIRWDKISTKHINMEEHEGHLC